MRTGMTHSTDCHAHVQHILNRLQRRKRINASARANVPEATRTSRNGQAKELPLEGWPRRERGLDPGSDAGHASESPLCLPRRHRLGCFPGSPNKGWQRLTQASYKVGISQACSVHSLAASARPWAGWERDSTALLSS